MAVCLARLDLSFLRRADFRSPDNPDEYFHPSKYRWEALYITVLQTGLRLQRAGELSLNSNALHLYCSYCYAFLVHRPAHFPALLVQSKLSPSRLTAMARAKSAAATRVSPSSSCRTPILSPEVGRDRWARRCPKPMVTYAARPAVAPYLRPRPSSSPTPSAPSLPARPWLASAANNLGVHPWAPIKGGVLPGSPHFTWA